jgi:hypothetical protein
MRERSARSAKPARDRRRNGARYRLPTEISPGQRRELTQHRCRSSIISGGQRHPGNPGLNLPKGKGAHCADRHPVSKRSQADWICVLLRLTASKDGLRMLTVVYQSYRSSGSPAWIDRCLASVREWAEARAYHYVFVGDELFDLVPAWYRERVGGQILPITDLARLELAARFLAEGYERAVWIDADVLVFDPQRFEINVNNSFTFSREVCLYLEDGWCIERGVNNSVAVFQRENTFLPFYIECCKRIVRQKDGVISPVDVGPVFLTNLYKMMPFPLVTTVGLFTPPILDDLVEGRTAFIRTYAEACRNPLYAANLCHSLGDPSRLQVPVPEALFAAAVERLIVSKGALINQLLEA